MNHPVARFRRIFAFALGAVLVFGLLALPVVSLRSLEELKPKAETEYRGDWKGYLGLDVTDRPLPKSHRMQWDWKRWNAEDATRQKYYWARIHGKDHQKGFALTHDRTRNMPWGDYEYTSIRFYYLDPRFGDYIFAWDQPGRHDPPAFRLCERSRTVILRPVGNLNAYPPEMEIVAMEGVKPRYPIEEAK